MTDADKAMFKENCPEDPGTRVECENCGEPWGFHSCWLCWHKDGADEFFDNRKEFYKLPKDFRFFLPDFKKILPKSEWPPTKLEVVGTSTCPCGVSMSVCAGCFDAPNCPQV